MQQRDTTDVARVLLSSGGLVLRSVAIARERTTIGRRPYNDIALDDLTVSGEHAAIVRQGEQWLLRDLRSRNGTTINGDPVTEHPLADGDSIGIGVYRLVFSGAAPAVGDAAGGTAGDGMIDVLTGPQAGAEIRLERPITSLGSAGEQVAVVARRRNGYHLTHLEGMTFPLVNGESIGLMACPLAHNDMIELGGTMMRFRTRA